MKASVLVAILKEFIRDHGDLNVVVRNPSPFVCSGPLKEANITTVVFESQDDHGPDRVSISGDWQKP